MLSFRFYSLRLHFTARGPVEFRAGQAANLLRGGLGAALRRISCRPDCERPGNCPRPSSGKASGEGEACAYARLFEPRATAPGPSGLANWPRPFVLRVAHLEGAAFPQGSTFHFGVHLFDLRPDAVQAIEAAFVQLGRDGLGSTRTTAALTLIEGAAQPLELPLIPSAGCVRRITVNFLTPTQLKGGGSGTDAGLPPFELLAARIRDRISTLRALYGEGPLTLDFRAFAESAAAIQTVGGALREVEVQRRSRGTGQTHSLGGFVGQVQYAGDLTGFLPYLRAAAFTGVGRQTVWGKGEICVDVVD